MALQEDCLRAACMAAVDDDAPWCVYLDWLLERGRAADAERLPRARQVLAAFPRITLEMAEDAAASPVLVVWPPGATSPLPPPLPSQRSGYSHLHPAPR